MSSTTHLLTYEEALALGGDRLEEIINGEVHRMPPASAAHGDLIEALADALKRQLPSDRFAVRIAGYGLGIQRAPLTARVPDLVVFDATLYRQYRQEHAGPGYLWLQPRLIAECLSPSNRKASIHRLLADYESIRAAEVWLIQPERRIVEQYLLTGEALEHSSSVSGGVVRPVHCPADIQVDDLWKAFYGE